MNQKMYGEVINRCQKELTSGVDYQMKDGHFCILSCNGEISKEFFYSGEIKSIENGTEFLWNLSGFVKMLRFCYPNVDFLTITLSDL